MKVIMIGGYPGCGKSTIVREVIHELEREGKIFKENRQGIVRYMQSEELIILGSYAEGEKFPGTDRLPLNVQPDAQKFVAGKFVSEQGQQGKGITILLEGDRLFNDKMIAFLKNEGIDLVLCIVKAAQVSIVSRREARSEQNESWRKGRESKVDRIGMVYPVHYVLINNSQEDFQACVKTLLTEITGKAQKKEVKSTLKNMWS